MNKKGQETEGRGGALITVLIAVAVLAIIGYSVYLFFTGKAFPFAQNIPGFNNTKPPVVDIELFKYDIASDRLQYYDGNNWLDFPKTQSLEANGKKFDYETLKADLTAPFIGKGKALQDNPKIAAVVMPALEFTSSTSKWNVPLRIVHGIFGGGTETLWLYGGRINLNIYDGGLEHLYILLDNTLYGADVKTYVMQKIEAGDKRSFVELGRGVMNAAITWRNDLLNSQVVIHYKDKENNVQPPIYTCFIKEHYTDDKALVVDLSRPKEGEGCPYSYST